MKKVIWKMMSAFLLATAFFSGSTQFLQMKAAHAANAKDGGGHAGTDRQGGSCG